MTFHFLYKDMSEDKHRLVIYSYDIPIAIIGGFGIGQRCKFNDRYYSKATTIHQAIARAIAWFCYYDIADIYDIIYNCKTIKDLRHNFGYCPKGSNFLI